MNHICYINSRTNDFDYLREGKKTMLLRGVKQKKAPYECVFPGDRIYFSDETGEIHLSSEVGSVLNFTRHGKISLKDVLKKHRDEIQIGKNRARKLKKKEFFVLIKLKNTVQTDDVNIDHVVFRDRNAWIMAGDVETGHKRGIKIQIRIK